MDGCRVDCFGQEKSTAGSRDDDKEDPVLINVVPVASSAKEVPNTEDMLLEDLGNLPGQVPTSEKSLGPDFTQLLGNGPAGRPLLSCWTPILSSGAWEAGHIMSYPSRDLAKNPVPSILDTSQMKLKLSGIYSFWRPRFCGDAMILSSNLNKDPSPFAQHPRTVSHSDPPTQLQVEKRTRADSDNSADSDKSGQSKGRKKKHTHKSFGDTDNLQYYSMVNHG